MQKYIFSIRTRDGQYIERLVIAGKERGDAERKLKQMYHHCEVVRCEPHPQGALGQGAIMQGQSNSIEDILSLIAR